MSKYSTICHRLVSIGDIGDIGDNGDNGVSGDRRYRAGVSERRREHMGVRSKKLLRMAPFVEGISQQVEVLRHLTAAQPSMTQEKRGAPHCAIIRVR